MATKKISELEAINAAEDNDVLVIVDTSESTTNKITKGNLLIGAGHTIEMTLNENYQIVLVLKNAAGTALSTQTIDLPNENAVTNLAYNNGILTVTKQSGATSQINLMGLIEGLVTESDFNTFKEALQTTLEAINEKDAEQDEAIAENYKVINKLNEKLENQQKVIDQLPQVTGQGTEVTLENTIEAPFTKFDVEGNSDQETTTGKNLLPNNATTQTYFGITITKKDDGTLILNGTATDNIQLNLLNNKRNNTMLPEADIKYSLESGIYKLSGCTNGSSSTYKLDVWIDRAEGLKATCFNQEVQFTLDEEKIVSYLRLVVYSGATLNNVVIKPMVRLASVTDDTYEPYTGGIASPNPNYEQPIESAGDNENLFDKDNEEQFLQNLTPDNGGLIISARTSTTSANYIRTIIIPCKSDANYVITRFLGGKTFFIYESDEYPTLNKQTTLLKRNNDTGKVSEIIKTSATAKYLLVKIYNTFASEYYSYDEFISSIKIEQGTKATPYSPYGMGRINEKINNGNIFDGIMEQGDIPSYNGQNQNNTLCIRSKNYIPLQPSTAYFFERFGLITDSVGLRFYDKDKNYLSSETTSIGYNVKSKAFTTGNNVYYMRFTDWTNNLTNTYMLSKGNKSVPYVPHKEQDYSIFVQQSMRSIGDVRDKFVKVNGNWFERHCFGEVNQSRIVNGPVVQGFYIIPEGIKKGAKLLSTHQQLGTSENSEEWKKYDGSQMKQLYPKVHNGVYINYKADTKQEQVDWWNSLNATLLYELETPLDLPCTEEQIQQLENLPSTYKDFTYVVSEDETPAYLEVSGIYDLNKLISRVEVIESEV